MNFRRFDLPTGNSVLIPSDIELKLPDNSSLDAEKLHFLFYIPWNDTYLQSLDNAYKDFFQRDASLLACQDDRCTRSDLYALYK